MTLPKSLPVLLTGTFLALLAPSPRAAPAPTDSAPPPTKQIQITATFLEVQQAVLQPLNFKWKVTNTAHSNSSTTGSPVAASPPANPVSSPPTTTITQGTIDPVTGLLVAGNTANAPQAIQSLPGGINVGAGAISPLGGNFGVLNGYSAPMILNALEQTQSAEILAVPKVIVISGREAQISVTQDGPKLPNLLYSTDPIGTTLYVLPVVKDDDSIDYSIKASLRQLISEQNDSNGLVQQTDVTELVSSGNVWDGQTITFDLGAVEPPPSPNSTASATSSGNTTTTAPSRHRYAFITFNLLGPHGELSQKDNQIIFAEPTGVAPTFERRPVSAPQPSP